MDKLSNASSSSVPFATSLATPTTTKQCKTDAIPNEILDNRYKRVLVTLGLGVLYAFLFYQGEVGLNALIFDALLLLAFSRMDKHLIQRPLFIAAAAGLLVSGIAVVIVNSWLASYAHFISLFVVIGVARVREIRFVWFALLLGLTSFVRTPLDMLNHWKDSVTGRREDGSFHLRYVLVPAFIILPFLTIYYQANPSFQRAVDGLFAATNIISGWSFLLFLWGSLIGATLLFPFYGESLLAKIGATFTENVPRKRNGPKTFLSSYQRPAIMGLKHEYELARATLLSLNVLLLLVNLTDIFTVWFGGQERSAAELSRFVHSGTYLLMGSIVLAILVVLIYFRGLLNYYPRVKILRKLAFIWIGQNALLAISLAIRNSQYISGYGLAWGRIQVFFLLLLIAIGLYTLYRKVDHRQSITSLLHNNGMAAWLCFIAFAAVNWDGIITRYNMACQTPEQLDTQYLINGLEGNEFLLMNDQFTDTYIQKKQAQRATGVSADFNQIMLDNLHYKLSPRQFHYHDWRSWNYSDFRNYRSAIRFQQHLLNIH